MNPSPVIVGIIAALAIAAASAQAPVSPADQRALNPQPLPPKSLASPLERRALNPQPLPPKSSASPLDRRALNPQPLPPKSSASPLDRRALNPQPLPPKVPTTPVRRDTPATLTERPPTIPPSAAQAPAPNDLLQLDDRAIIIVGGKPVPAGEIKQEILAELAKLAGPPKTIKSGTRKSAVLAQANTGRVPLSRRMPQVASNEPASRLGVAAPPQARVGELASIKPPLRLDAISKGSVPNARALLCLDKGPPTLSEVSGPLRPGKTVTLDGLCLGERPGAVEIIGQFPGGKLKPPFAAWTMTHIELTMPADIRGAVDHAASVTVVAADGRRTPAVQAQYVAARERVEVPESRWFPGPRFEQALAVNARSTSNPARAGQLPRSVRVNPQCALNTMEVVVLAGAVTAINGWEDGLPNEASVAIDWLGVCLNTTISKREILVGGIRYESACRVALHARAWADCPTGVTP